MLGLGLEFGLGFELGFGLGFRLGFGPEMVELINSSKKKQHVVIVCEVQYLCPILIYHRKSDTFTIVIFQEIMDDLLHSVCRVLIIDPSQQEETNKT